MTARPFIICTIIFKCPYQTQTECPQLTGIALCPQRIKYLLENTTMTMYPKEVYVPQILLRLYLLVQTLVFLVYILQLQMYTPRYFLSTELIIMGIGYGVRIVRFFTSQILDYIDSSMQLVTINAGETHSDSYYLHLITPNLCGCFISIED